MKPPETLSMLEEAAGTRMYEVNKERALKTLEKKQAKVDEIDRVLSEEILPSLEKLRKERAQYMQWSGLSGEVDRLKRFCISYSYVEAEKAKDRSLEKANQMKAKIEELTEGVKTVEAEMNEKAEAVARMVEEKEKQLGGEMEQLSSAVDLLQNTLAKEASARENQKEMLLAEKKTHAQLKKNAKEADASVTEKETAVAKANQEMEAGRAQVEALTKAVQELEAKYEAVQAGKTADEEGSKTLVEKLSEVKAASVEADTEAKQAQLTVTHITKEVGAKRKLLATKQKEAESMAKEMEMRRNAVSKSKEALAQLAFDENRATQLEDMKARETQAVRSLRVKRDELLASVTGIDFVYSDPVRGFDRSKVKGIVARTIRVKDPSTSLALEVGAGGKLYNVIVDTEQTGKLLLEKGGLKRRVTLIPLNKIEAHAIPQSVQAAAARLVRELDSFASAALNSFPCVQAMAGDGWMEV
ncbi:hypothetical protein CBR_g40806 [Chara braunii]|uniref:SMC hinge domain-containing protein n=1 Tax=Chara braunii TaxID=69332 RepID=A0A388LUS8_CHABU|nr:hypothetical protein CBR_g40806 [Chara braunii]|eukprot:GBG85993.1 hypothetical protein CBR_g40806 [Chara braunii]